MTLSDALFQEHHFSLTPATFHFMRKEFLQRALAKARDTPPKAFQTTLTASSSWPFTVDRPPLATRPTTIAVLDSSFNPPTLAHYHLLKAAARKAALGCDSVLLLLAMNNVDKGQTGASAVERLEMMEALAQECILNDREDAPLRHMAVGLTIHARFIDKAQPILDSYPPETVRLLWIMGHDTLTRLLDPKYYKDIKTDLAPFFEHNHAVCSTRPDYGTRDDLEQVIQQSGHADKVTLVEIEAEDENISTMSSTIVRKAVHDMQWELVKKSVSPSVLKAIEANGLYDGSTDMSRI